MRLTVNVQQLIRETTRAAVALLVEEESKKHTIVKNVYQFFSLLAPEPLILYHVVKYVAATLGADHRTIESDLVTTSPINCKSGF